MEQLRDCPFCGHEVMAVQGWNRIEPSFNGWFVLCNFCDLLFGFDTDYGGRWETKEQVTKAWNTRKGE